MDTANIREQHFMAISSEAEVLCQQLKGKGMYPVPPTYTQITKPMFTFSLYNRQSSLHYNLRTDCFSILCSIQREGQPDRNHTAVMTPCRATIPHRPKYSLHHHVCQNLPSHQHHMWNQVAVEQHTRVQSPPVPPRNTATVATSPQESQGTSVAQEPLITLAAPQQAPPQVQEQMTRPSHQPRKSKSKDGQGVKQSRNNKTTDGAPACWRCG